MTLAAGTRLGPYEIVAPLGAGGMGEVYRARDPRLDREVAVKVLPAEVLADPDRLRRFEQEARAAAALNHPNILAVFDVGSHGGTPYVVSELLEGETLRQRLQAATLPVRKAVDYGVQIAQGLAAAHAKGIVHRDLKPENLFVTSDGRIKILDFGLAKLAVVESAPGDLAAAATLSEGTAVGTVLGTVGYMAPEQVRGEPADARSDLFAFGAILYEMLIGRRAFQRETAPESLTAILREEPPEALEGNPELPPSLAHVVRRCLEKRPDERFQSARDLAFALREAASLSEVSGPTRAPLRTRPRKGLWLAATAILVTAAIALWLVLRSRGEGEAPGPAAGGIASLAVLPLENLSGDPGQEYFADGMTEALIAQLAKLESLKVISRTSVMRYKGVHKPLPEIGRELGVEGILEGSVLRAGDRVRITAQLIHAPSDRHLWAESYERELRDVLALQGEVARAVAGAIALRLTAQEERRLTSARPVDPGAYDAYLQARFFWNRRTGEALQRAIELFREAIALDPDYAPAHAGLADAYTVAYSWAHIPFTEGLPLARQAAERAVALDPGLGEAYAARAIVNWDSWDFAAAREDFRRARELSPSYATAHQWYGEFVAYSTGRWDQAIVEAERAAELDPLSLMANSWLGRVYANTGSYEQAIDQLAEVLEMDPEFAPAHDFLSEAYVAMGRFDDALAEVEAAARFGGSRLAVEPARAYALARAGRRREALAIVADLESRRVPEIDYRIARVYAALGDGDSALRSLETAFRRHEYRLQRLAGDPAFESLRSDPRYVELMRRVGLIPEMVPEPASGRVAPIP